MKRVWIIFALVVLSTVADDTQLYVFESSQRTGIKPKVLIILDNSGSMNTLESTPVPYDPSIMYEAVGSQNALQQRMLYFTKGTVDGASLPVPDSPSESRRFLAEINGCAASWQALEKYGFFTGFFREYSFKGQSGSWKEVPDNSGANIEIIDCYEDIQQEDWRNADNLMSGFAVDGVGTKKNPQYYSNVDSSSTSEQLALAKEAALNTQFGVGTPITLYTDNYLRWYYGDLEQVHKTRLDIAKEVMTNYVIPSPGVDMGMALFNFNGPEGERNGGRIIQHIDPFNANAKQQLISKLQDVNAETWTPLAESLYEAYRYFAGATVLFGDDDSSYSNTYRVTDESYLAMDPSCVSGGQYNSPFAKCIDNAYVVIITDGAPTYDKSADNFILGLQGTSSNDQYQDSYLPALAYQLHNFDVNPNLDGKQTITTFTIGFGEDAQDAAPVLTAAANRGGGKYFSASNATGLQLALQNILSKILEVNASFTSPSIASNNFDRTQTLSSIYYGMFLPDKGPRWQGNLKKLIITANGDVIDNYGKNAINEKGNISSDACTVWTSASDCQASSSGGDGNNVNNGGAQASLTKQLKRTLYGNFGSNNSLSSFNLINAQARAGGSLELASYMGVQESDLVNIFDWISGADITDDDADGDLAENRKDIIGDPLHSKPLAITYGQADGSVDVRILMGTNHGWLHMFKDEGASISESWAFMPYELLTNINSLYQNNPTGVHSVYGIDSSPVAYINDVNRNGVIEPGDKVWIFVGMRRGGSSYYAFDVTTPDSPSLLWQITPATSGYSEMGQTWSEPRVTLVPGWPEGNTNLANAKPVLVVGAGYQPATKDLAGLTVADSKGRGAFIIDAETGTLVFSIGASDSGADLTHQQMQYSIPNSPALLDSDGDGLSDRIYLTDSGGQLWRVDLPSGTSKSGEAPWTVFKFANIKGSDIADDRRFYAEPVVAQTIINSAHKVQSTDQLGNTVEQIHYTNRPYDAIAIGSGIRPQPNDIQRQDKLFLFRDMKVATQSFTESNPAPQTIEVSDLYDVTADPFAQQLSQQQQSELELLFGEKKGWYYDLPAKGEKSLAAASILGGKVYFSSYTPGDLQTSNQCLIAGQGKLYVFDLHRGFNTFANGFYDLGERVPDTPQMVVPASQSGAVFLVGVGSGELQSNGQYTGTIKTQVTMQANRIYYHINE
ncbi:pilus assembly protein [Paraferrimonas sp. SM1919]|uniref:pilus assembly protein n=1 Tax=Paraferrimonas sp. SM1919 TaxID=2662263 RepID=UPI0013D061B5|nr:PilC/PilY family type IV pilus protein [Paraferrimonas sp. SM1919]